MYIICKIRQCCWQHAADHEPRAAPAACRQARTRFTPGPHVRASARAALERIARVGVCARASVHPSTSARLSVHTHARGGTSERASDYVHRFFLPLQNCVERLHCKNRACCNPLLPHGVVQRSKRLKHFRNRDCVEDPFRPTHA